MGAREVLREVEYVGGDADDGHLSVAVNSVKFVDIVPFLGPSSLCSLVAVTTARYAAITGGLIGLTYPPDHRLRPGLELRCGPAFPG